MTYGSNRCESGFIDKSSGTVEGEGESGREQAPEAYELIRSEGMLQTQ